MQKIILLSAFSSLVFLWGCSFDLPSSTNVDVNTVVGSGVEVVSGAWNTAKGVGQDYYNDQIKPTVDTVIDQAKQEANTVWQEAKNQYNSGMDQVNQQIDEWTQNQANQAKDQVNKLKVE